MEEPISHATKHILVVDDDARVCASLERLLRSAGLSATCALGGAAALSRLAEFTPDLVLVDLSMPQIDGFEVLRRVRADPRTASVPVIMFSAMSEPALRDRAIGAGANGFWSKVGFDYASLAERLMEFMVS
jgi:CheY-like chemotaxis protein